MHFPKPDTFVIMCAAMSEKMVEQQNTILDLTTHLAGHHEQMDDMQHTITDLRTQLEEKYHLQDQVYELQATVRALRPRAERCDELKNSYDTLYAEVRKLRAEKLRGELNLPLQATPEEAANAYMLLHGVKQYDLPYEPGSPVLGGKIQCIKVIREVTEWGLKESKDFVEAYMARHEREKEETPSGTKRSSQVPAGVGESVKKSA